MIASNINKVATVSLVFIHPIICFFFYCHPQVEHGLVSPELPYYCTGFLIGLRPGLLYLSDVSGVPEDVRTAIAAAAAQAGGRLDVAVVDALRRKLTNPSHWSLEQALEALEWIRPRRRLWG